VPSPEVVELAAPPAEGSYAGRVKLGTRITKSLKRELKIAAANHDRTEESIVIEAIQEWLAKNPRSSN
jgi:hypothetical protein